MEHKRCQYIIAWCAHSRLASQPSDRTVQLYSLSFSTCFNILEHRRFVPRCHSQDFFEHPSRGGPQSNPVCIGYGRTFVNYLGGNLSELRCLEYIPILHASYS